MTTIIHEPQTLPKTRRETLLDAAALIEEHGWTTGGKGMPGDIGHTGSLCLLGGVAKSLGLGNAATFIGYEEAAEVIHGRVGDDLTIQEKAYTTYDWNDGLSPEHGGRIAVRALRRLADGATWKEAIA